MAFAFGHLIGAWLAGKIYEFVRKTKISHETWFFLLIGGILPDIDFVIDWTLQQQIHRTITHSLFFIILISTLTYFIFYKSKQRKSFALAIAAGITTHLLLDMDGSGLPLLWPSMIHISSTAIAPFHYGSLFQADQLAQKVTLSIIDMALGTAWIFYLWWRKQIRF